MEQGDTGYVVSAAELLKALVGEESNRLQQLDKRNVKSTVLFLEAARRRLDALVNKAVSQSNER